MLVDIDQYGVNQNGSGYTGDDIEGDNDENKQGNNYPMKKL